MEPKTALHIQQWKIKIKFETFSPPLLQFFVAREMLQPSDDWIKFNLRSL